MKKIQAAGEAVRRKNVERAVRERLRQWRLTTELCEKMEQFVNTRRGKDLVGLLKRHADEQKEKREKKKTAFLFALRALGRRSLRQLRKMAALQVESKRSLFAHFKRKVRDQKRGAFNLWGDKVSAGGALRRMTRSLAAGYASRRAFWMLAHWRRLAYRENRAEGLLEARNWRARQRMLGAWRHFCFRENSMRAASEVVAAQHRNRMVLLSFYAMLEKSKLTEQKILTI